VPSRHEKLTRPGLPSPNQPNRERAIVYRDGSGPNSRSDAHCAIIVGDWEEPSGESRLKAIEEAGTELRDLVWVQESYSVKILRDGNYPVLRGTFVDLGGKGLLYTNGSIPYYGTYPGLYDPRPLLLCPHESCDSTISQISEEVFSLTKINWNSTQMNQRLPIPIRAARMVGGILKYLKEGQVESSDYRKYI